MNVKNEEQQQQKATTNRKKKTKEDLRVTELGTIEPLYDEFDGEMYGTS